MNIIEAIKDENLFRSFLADKNGSLQSWRSWLIALRVIFGLTTKTTRRSKLIRKCTGRDPDKLPEDGFQTCLMLIGRRSGKSVISALIGAYIAILSGKEALLKPGEIGLVAIVSTTRFQARIVRSYLRAIFDSTPMLQAEVVSETKDGFQLRNGIEIQILTGTPAYVRGFTLLACVVDEICMFGYSEESKVRSDTELIQALRPALATVNGRLICIGSPYAKKGFAYKTHKQCFGNDKASTLVWNCPTTVMNPLLPQRIVDEALAEDLAAAKAEWLAEFRDDVAIWLPREAIEAIVVKGRKELPPRQDARYVAFVDVSGGRVEDSAISIAHKADSKIVIDYARRWRSPHSPHTVVSSMADELRRFGIRRVIGDNYSGDFVGDAFRSNGIKYDKSKKTKSDLFLETVGRFCSNEVELLDDPVLIDQFAALERRTRSGGRDSVDHPAGGKDDLANAVAGVIEAASGKRIVVGAFGCDQRTEPLVTS